MKKHKYYYRNKINFVVKEIFKKNILKIIRSNLLINKTLRQRAINKLTSLNVYFNINKLKKFCIITGRLRFIIKDSKFSRIIFRNFVSFKFLNGFSKNA